jgi:hypothetical protein
MAVNASLVTNVVKDVLELDLISVSLLKLVKSILMILSVRLMDARVKDNLFVKEIMMSLVLLVVLVVLLAQVIIAVNVSNV